MALLERGGARLFYESAGSGPAILLSHGYGASSHMWAGQVAAFSGDFQVITWDMRGHGRTESPTDLSGYSREATVDDMAAILDACGVETAVIGGLSLGGYMSLAFQVAHAERTRALMLFDTGPGYRNPKAREGWNEFAEGRAITLERDGIAGLGGGNETLAAGHRSAGHLALAARGMLKQFDDSVILALPEIAVPTLVLVGDRDTPFLAATDAMATLIPGARKVVIGEAGHASNLDQPETFNAAVREFLATLPV